MDIKQHKTYSMKIGKMWMLKIKSGLTPVRTTKLNVSRFPFREYGLCEEHFPVLLTFLKVPFEYLD